MRDFELIEQAIAAHERELQKLESEIQEKRQLLAQQKEAVALLQPLLASVLDGSTEVVTIKPDSVFHKMAGAVFSSGNRERHVS